MNKWNIVGIQIKPWYMSFSCPQIRELHSVLTCICGHHDFPDPQNGGSLEQNFDEGYSQFSICHYMEMSIPSSRENITGMFNIKCKYNGLVGWLCQLCFT